MLYINIDGITYTITQTVTTNNTETDTDELSPPLRLEVERTLTAAFIRAADPGLTIKTKENDDRYK